MRTTDSYKSHRFRREETVIDPLTSSKRRFIENWRQNVSVFMENGNICRVTIGEVTPEPTNDTCVTRAGNVENVKSSTGDLSSRQDMASPSLPAVKFSYCHVSEGSSSRLHRTKSDRSCDKYSQSRPTLPPSPNGFVVQNGMDLRQAYKRRTSGMRAPANNMKSTTEVTELPEVNNEKNDNKDLTRKSSKLAREIYEKYNMKSSTHTMLPGKTTVNGIEQYSMPWRNKTFLSLPLRFNGSIKPRGQQLSREKTNVTELRANLNEADDELKFTKDWEEFRNW